MAIYQGARRRSVLPLGSRAAYGTNPSPTPPSTSGAPPPAPPPPGGGGGGGAGGGGRARPLRLLLGAIVVAFLLAIFSLAQTVRLTATDYEVDRLLGERDRLDARRLELLAD